MIHLDYGSDFRDITGIIKLFSQHKDKNRIVNTIQKGSLYHLSFIEEETGKYYLISMLLRGNYKPSKSDLNTAAMEKAMVKEVEHRWKLTLTIDFI